LTAVSQGPLINAAWAIDFFTVNTIRFARLYVFVVLHHGRRKVVHFAITANPSMGFLGGTGRD